MSDNQNKNPRHKSTWLTKEAASDQRQWYVVDLEGQILGRAATQIATVLRGKHKPTYTPNVDSGDFVVVVNAGKVKLTGAKLKNKMYRYYTGYPGGLRESAAQDVLVDKPERVIREAVWGMLPKGRLGRQIIKKLKVYGGAEHNHSAQQPKPMEITRA